MPYEIFLALRYLYSRRRRPLARVTALAAILGVALGVAALIVALALSNGFRDEMRDKILRGTAHITLMRSDGQPLREWRAVAARVARTGGVSDATGTTYDGALLSAGEAGSAYAVLRGVDRDSARAVAEIRRTLVSGTVEPLLRDEVPEAQAEPAATQAANEKPKRDGSIDAGKANGKDAGVDESPSITSFDESQSEAALPGVIVGAEMAARMGLRVGDVAQLVSGDATLTPLGLAPRYRRVSIAGVFRSGLYEYDSTWIYMPLPLAASFAGQPSDSASVISIEVADIYNVAEVSSRVRAGVGAEYTTVDWQEANRPLFAALALERRMGLAIITLIILMAALNITTMLVLVVVERRSDIAILGAMGASARSIMCVFMIEGAGCGLIGAVAGVALGLVTCFVGDRYRLVRLPADVYSLSSIPFHPHARDVALAALAAFLLSLLATLYPARAAARVRPAEALREF
ncbi:MAG TPA: ABC transporter permease [Pyrinomonadaceae bacterium]|jgi:lipoprotein-releasing system permease protein|nr:ABC transporter permease [Pyrinomonadaceae bacterium]